ncbi:MAG: serine/threonine-protein kinase, partial [Polyangiaceae bacterium]
MVHRDEEIAPGIRLLEPIGSGGMAEVWRARHERLDVDVAVKVIRAPLATPIALERFALEARVAARLRDPHVVQVFDYGTTGSGFPFIVMELLEGEALDDYLDLEVRMTPTDAITVGRQLAGALDDVHATDIVHRDIKPGNIWLTHDGHDLHAKLIDFGIARVPAALRGGRKLTTKGQLVGTPAYMSPEQL